MKTRMIGWLAAALLGIPPAAHAQSCVVTAPANGLLGSCPNVLASGSSCSFACDSGFFIVGSATSCKNGVLTAQTCAPQAGSCSVTAPANGTLGNCPATLASGASCSFACDTGYFLTGPAATSCSNGQLTQQSCALPAAASPTAEAPIPLWALGALGAGLMLMASRRMKRAG